jgi:hypothetical protein
VVATTPCGSPGLKQVESSSHRNSCDVYWAISAGLVTYMLVMPLSLPACSGMPQAWPGSTTRPYKPHNHETFVHNCSQVQVLFYRYKVEPLIPLQQAFRINAIYPHTEKARPALSKFFATMLNVSNCTAGSTKRPCPAVYHKPVTTANTPDTRKQQFGDASATCCCSCHGRQIGTSAG